MLGAAREEEEEQEEEEEEEENGECMKQRRCWEQHDQEEHVMKTTIPTQLTSRNNSWESLRILSLIF